MIRSRVSCGTSSLNSKFQQAVFADETPETRERMHDVCDAYEKLEQELLQHIELLRASRWKLVASRLSLLSAAPK